MISKFDSEKTINRGFEAGASDYILKSDVRNQLYERVVQISRESSFFREKTILLVESSDTTRILISRRLSNYGFKVVTARNGESAFQVLQKQPVNLVLLEVFLPDMSGIEFLRQFRNWWSNAHIPVISMGKNSDRRSIRKMQSMGSSTYLIKPFNIDSLVILMEKLLSDQYLFMLHEKDQLEYEQRALLDNISSLITALEARDTYTKGHSENVSRIAAGMVKAAGAPNEEVELVARGALLHDIGKIGISDTILNKAGRLSPEEYLEIKQHPEIGYNILAPISSLERIHPLVLHHHERFDGTGYPHGLRGEEIPEWARIVAVADTYDALTNDRPYKKAVNPEEAFRILNEVKGGQLCPDSVDLFFTYIKSNAPIGKEPIYEKR